MLKKKRPSFTKGAYNATFTTPEEVFFSLTRAPSHGYLRGQQQDVLREYATKGTSESDVAFELPTGTGKSAVGLLLAEWKRHRGQKAAYLCLNNQLAAQVIAEGADLGIPVADLRGDKSSRNTIEVGRFLTGEAIAVTTYSNLFNVNPVIKDCALVVFDDAHGGEQYAADMWTVTVDAQKNAGAYSALLGALRGSLSPAQFAEVTEGDYSIVQLADLVGHPECIPAVRGILDAQKEFGLSWQKIRAKLTSCLFLISSSEIAVRPLIPPTHCHPPFAAIGQRVYLSATLGGRSDLQRAYGVKQIALFRAKSAQWGKRYIFVPGIFTDEDGAFSIAARIWEGLPIKRALLIAPSDRAADKAFANLEAKTTTTPVRLGADDIKDDLAPFTASSDAMLVLAGRYDGLDLPDDDCRLLLLAGSPAATNPLERHLMSKWKMGPVVRRKERTRLIQGMGRCTRSATDFAVVVWLGQSLVDVATSPSAVRQMPVDLQNELAWGIQQVKGAAENMQMLVDMMVGLIEDRDYRKEANEEIAKLSPKASEVTDEDTSSGIEEVKFARAMWDGDYSFAFETARSIAESATAPSMAGYRGWWWYLASVAARLSGNKAAEIDCLWHSSKSGVYTGFAPYLLSERKAKSAADSSVDVPINVEAIWDTVDGWGWSGPKFDRTLESMLGQIQNDEPTKFHEGLELLGECAGASVIRPTTGGAPDVVWSFLERFCVCFEAKTDKKADGFIYKKDLEEAKLHPEWAKHQLKLGDACEFASVLISPTSRIDKIAVPFVEGVFYLPPAALRAFAVNVVTVLRKLRAKFAGRDFPEAEKEFAAEIIAAKLDYNSVKNLLIGLRLVHESK